MTEWHKILYLGFLYINIGVGEVKIPKFRYETAFSKQGYFRHFSNSKGIFADKSLLLNLPVLKAPVLSIRETKSRFVKNHIFDIHTCTE